MILLMDAKAKLCSVLLRTFASISSNYVVQDNHQRFFVLLLMLVYIWNDYIFNQGLH